MDTKSIATIAGAAAAGGVLAFAGLSLASAATGSNADHPNNMTADHQAPPEMGMPHGTPVTGEAADKVKAAVLAQYPDATVAVVEEEGDGYEAHVRKADGTLVHITLDSSFAITGEHTGPPMGGPRGPHGEKPLQGAKAKKVTAAAERRVSGGTVVRVEKNPQGGYEAHVVKKDGRLVVVEVGNRFQVTGVEEMGRPPFRGGPPPQFGDQPAPSPSGGTA